MKSRIAPTPSGYLHRGNAANFALNSLLAPSGELLLRIDDLDRGRFREEYLADIFKVLKWLGIQPTEGPRSPEDFHKNWSQEHRLAEYQLALDRLRTHPAIFACPCTRKQLSGGEHAHDCLNGNASLDAKGVAWRVNVRQLTPVLRIPDMVVPEGFEVVPGEVIPDFVVRKKDGRPSYQLACTVDDVLHGVTHVGRGQDLLPSTAAQALLSDLLGYQSLFDRITFVHHPLLTEADGEKLSKSAGAKGISELMETITPEEIFAQARKWLE